MTKPLHAGKAAANGVLAARLAAAGLAGPADPLGAGGVLEVLAAAWTGTRSAAAGRKGTLGARAEHDSRPIRAAWSRTPRWTRRSRDVRRRIDPAEITAITLRCHPLVPELMGTQHPADGLRSRFSARHGVAVGLLFGRAGLAEFSDAVATAPEVARLRAPDHPGPRPRRGA